VNSTYKESPFHKIFVEAINKTAIEDGMPDDIANPFHMKELFPYVLRYFLPFYPFWSRYLQCMVIPDAENPLTNSTAELRIKQEKEDVCGKKKNMRPARFLKKMVKDADRRILEFEYPTDFKKNSKRKRNQEEEEVHEIKQSREENGSVMKKTCKEKWQKRGTSTRVPGGLYSAKEAEKYAEKLANFVEKLPQPQDTSEDIDDPEPLRQVSAKIKYRLLILK
jgi:hypothetical protein